MLEITFYPDDHGFNALVKAMRASCRTYELFEIARLILGKPERCVVVFRRRKESPQAPNLPLFVSVPDGMPFETEDEAIRYTLERHMDKFFTMEDVEVEPPKGTFQFVNRCPITKELLGPPNYHRYAHILKFHYDTHAIRVPFEDYKASIEVVREPEVVQQWLESAKKVTRYTFKGPEGTEPVVFDNPEEARTHLLSNCRELVVRSVDSARLSAKVVTESGRTEAARALQGAIDMQRRFPLDSANALRGRLRRENFHIFKRGSKGVTYVCSVRRKFRNPGEVFSDSITKLVEFLDKNPRIPISALPEKFLGFSLPHEAPVPTTVAAVAQPPPAVDVSETDAGESSQTGESAASVAPVASPKPAAPHADIASLKPEQKSALDRLLMDLRWLVGEGYVAEYSDGRLFVHPVVEPNLRKSKDDSDDDHDSHSEEESSGSEPVDQTDAVAESKPEPPAEKVQSSAPVEPAETSPEHLTEQTPVEKPATSRE